MAKMYDPRMHTAEHVLNQTMIRMFGSGRCFSAHINPGKSKCDYRFLRGLTTEEEKELEARVNDVLMSGADVREEWLLRAEAAEKYDLGRLPEDAGEKVRVVHVGEYDACPCIGPHVENTGQVGRMIIVSSEFANDILRIRFKLA